MIISFSTVEGLSRPNNKPSQRTRKFPTCVCTSPHASGADQHRSAILTCEIRKGRSHSRRSTLSEFHPSSTTGERLCKKSQALDGPLRRSAKYMATTVPRTLFAGADPLRTSLVQTVFLHVWCRCSALTARHGCSTRV
jgi:hypothetical protein